MPPVPIKPNSRPKGTTVDASQKPTEASSVGGGLKKFSDKEKKGKPLGAYLSNALMLVLVGVALISFYLVAAELVEIQRFAREKKSIQQEIAVGKEKYSSLLKQIAELEVEAERADANATLMGKKEAEISNRVSLVNDKLTRAVLERKKAIDDKDAANEEKQKANLSNQYWGTSARESSTRDAQLKSQISESIGERARLNDEISDLKAELEKLKVEQQDLEPKKIELAEIQANIKQLQQILDNLRAQESGALARDQAESARLSKKRDDLKKRIDDLSQQEDQLDASLAGLKNKIIKTQGDDRNLGIHYKKRFDEFNDKQTEIEQLKVEQQKLSNDIAILQATKARLAQETQALASDKQKSVQAKREEIIATEATIAATAKRDRMISQNAGLEAEMQRLEGLKKKLLAEIGNLESEKKDLETPSSPQ